MALQRFNRDDVGVIVKLFVVFALIYFAFNIAKASTIKIAVIDTGLNKEVPKRTVKLCDSGHTDFTKDNDPFKDNVLHGTNISGIINAWAYNTDYCQVILKYTNNHDGTVREVVKAINKAIELKVDIIHMSLSGLDFNLSEQRAVKKALDSGIKVVTALGNISVNVAEIPNYPACYDSRIRAVEATDEDNKLLVSSNFLAIRAHSKCKLTTVYSEEGKRLGIKVMGNKVLRATGTSQAAARYSGKLVKRLEKANRSYKRG
jgi:serine protease